MPRKKKFDKTKDCVRCKVAQGNIVVRYAVYCKECFFRLITFKFRRSLEPFVNPKPDGPRKTALKPAGGLLVGFSGGLGSTVLLDLVHRCYVSMDKATMPTEGGRDHPRHERVWKKVSVCYIEVCDAIPGMKDNTAEIAELIARHDGIEFIPVRIQDAFDHDWWERVGGISGSFGLDIQLTDEELLVATLSNRRSTSTPLQSLRSYLASLPTATALSATLQTLTRLLLLHTAIDTGSSHLVLGTSLTSLAISLISGVAQGRGFNVKEEMQEEWTSDRDLNTPVANDSQSNASKGKRGNNVERRSKRSVRVIRPLRDVGMKECAMWAWWNGLKVTGKEKWQWPGVKQDIGILTKDFIIGLEKNYPSTVSTIVRTCAKVAPKGEVAGRCIMCERPVQQGIAEWRSRISIRSLSQTSNVADIIQCGTDPLLVGRVSSASLTRCLCYACYTTLTSRSSRPIAPLYPSMVKPTSAALPTWANSRKEIFRQALMGEEQMRSVIGDFLLDGL
ncbi:hypothetical protein AcV7_006667 [Taiwanofungus camphoratus]|nr:hypothetical protein AcV7_006667 [Antrodia cinnamomea]